MINNARGDTRLIPEKEKCLDGNGKGRKIKETIIKKGKARIKRSKRRHET